MTATAELLRELEENDLMVRIVTDTDAVEDAFALLISCGCQEAGGCDCGVKPGHINID